MSTVVVSLGTDHHPFTRLVGWMDAWATQHPDIKVFVQYGHSDAPRIAQGVAFLPMEQLRDHICNATAVVTHGGPGTMGDARDNGHTPIVVPRDPSLGEHIDNHQMLFSRRMAAASLVTTAATYDELATAIATRFEDPAPWRVNVDSSALPNTVDRFEELVADLRHRPTRKWRRR